MSGSHDRSLTTYRVDTGMCKPPSDGGEGREGQGTEEGRVLEHKGRSRQLPGRGREASGAPEGGKGGSLESGPAAPSSSVSSLPLNWAHRPSNAVKRTQGLALLNRLPRRVVSVATILSRLPAQPNFSKRCWHSPCPHSLPACCSGRTLLPLRQTAFARRLGTAHSLLAHSLRSVRQREASFLERLPSGSSDTPLSCFSMYLFDHSWLRLSCPLLAFLHFTWPGVLQGSPPRPSSSSLSSCHSFPRL